MKQRLNTSKRQTAKVGLGQRNGRFFVDPTLSGYENAVGECRSCGTKLTVNRATELDGTYPSAGQRFKCFACGETLLVGGDIANHPVDQIAYDAYEPLLRRQYTVAMLMIAQSLEWSLAMCVHQVVLGRLRRPKRLRPESPFAIVRAQLEKAMKRWTLGALRNIVAGMAVADVAAASTAEARDAIVLAATMTGKEQTQSAVEAIGRADLREAVAELIAAKSFVDLRNQIVHHGARPTQMMAERYYELVPRLATKLLRAFGVMRGQLVMPPRAGGGRRAG